MSDNVRVAVRVRPFNQRERDRQAKSIIRIDGRSTFISHPETGVEKQFSFDYSYDSFRDASDPEFASQSRVYGECAVLSAVVHVPSTSAQARSFATSVHLH